MTHRLLSINWIYDDLAHNPLLWLRPLVVIGVLLLSIAIPLKTPPLYLLFALGLFPGIAAVLIFMRWPALGIIIAIIGGVVVPFTGPSGLNVTLIMTALLFGLWVLDMVVQQRRLRLIPSRTIWPSLSFVSAALLSFGVGLLPWFTFAEHAPLGAQLGGLSIFILSAGAFLLAAHQIQDLDWLQWITWVFLAFAALFAAGQLIPVLRPFSRLLFQPIGSMFWIWVVSLTVSQAIFNRDLQWGWRLALGGLSLVALYLVTILKYEDKSGWIPSLVSVATIIGLRSWRTALALALIGTLPALYLVTGAVASDEYSVATRFDAMLIIAEIIKASPVLGLGFANYYWYTPLFPIRGYAVQFNSHNNYIDIVAQTGLVGLLCLMWFYGEVGWLAWRLRERVPAGFAQAYAYGALGGLAGMVVLGMLGDWVLPFFYNIGLAGFRSSVLGWLFLGGLVALEKIFASPSGATKQS